jgi:hypothetical protein
MNAPLHTLSEALVMTAETGMDPERGSSIAKPQKAFAIAFAVLAAALAGCASGLGANTNAQGAVGRGAYVDEGTVVGQSSSKSDGAETGVAYTIRLSTGELVSIAQAAEYAIPAGAPVLIEFGAQARVIPQ